MSITTGTTITAFARYGTAQVAICADRPTVGRAAAAQAARLINAAIDRRGKARIIVATGNSQIDFMTALVARGDVDWSAVDAFHMDEYVGITADHPSSFRLWIKTRFEAAHPKTRMHYIVGDAPDLEREIERYSQMLNSAPIDLAFVGFGENGHIAFNDPAVADFSDAASLKIVTLDAKCRAQQVGEGHFKDLASVPARAITITCPGLFRAAAWVCSVPEQRKAEAVRDALEGPVSTRCPASIVRTHPDAFVFLDLGSASLLSRETKAV